MPENIALRAINEAEAATEHDASAVLDAAPSRPKAASAV
jgi:hypothetical protein